MGNGSEDDDDVGIRGKVELSANWWKTAWPFAKRPDADGDMLSALRAYKQAKAGKSRGDLSDALDAIDKALAGLEGDAAKISRKHPLKKKAVTDDLAKARKLVAEQLAELQKYGNQERVVYRKDFGSAVGDRLKDIRVRIATRPVTLSVLEVVAQELDAKNGLALLNNMLNDRFDAAVSICDKDVRAIVRKAGGLMDADAMEACLKALDEQAAALEQEMREVPIAVFRKMRIHADIASRYKKEKAVTIAKGTGGVALGIAGAALPGTLPFALFTLARSVASLAKEIVTVLMDLDTKIKIFLSYIETLAAAYRLQRGTSEIAASALNAALGVEVLPTLNKAKNDLKEIEKCVAVFHHRATQLNKEIVEALDISNQLTARFEKSALDVKAFMSSPRGGKVARAMKNLDKLADKGHELMRQATTAEKQMPFLRKKLRDLGENAGSVDKANVIIAQLISFGLAVAGVCDAAAVGQAVESIVVAEIGGIKDAIDIGKELASL